MSGSFLSRAGLHTAGFYAAFFMAMGVHLPFWPLWLGDWGLTASEIGLFAALGMGARVVGGLVIPTLADRMDARRNTVLACTLVCMVLFVAHLWIGERAVLLAATLVIGAALAGISSIAEALGVAASRYHGFPYAQARGAGSLGFLAANLTFGGLIAAWGSDVALWAIVAGLAGVLVLAPGHPGGRRVETGPPPQLGEIARVMLHPVFALFVVTVAFGQGGHAVYYAFGTVHWRSLGIGEGTIGALWAVSVGAEIVLMVVFGATIVARLGPVGALAASSAAGVLRWGAMMFDPGLWMLWVLQASHALSFAVGHLAAVAFIARAVPARYGAAAQGAMGQVVVSLLTALAMALAAAAYPSFGGLSYAIAVAMSTVGLGLCLLLARRWHGEEIAV